MRPRIKRVKDKPVLDGLDAMRAKGKQLAKVFSALREPMAADQAKHAQEQRGPEGSWAPLASATLKARGRRSHTFSASTSKRNRKNKTITTTTTTFKASGILGVLPDLVKVQTKGGNSVVARAPKGIAAAHQFGDIVGRGSILPERPFVWVSPELGDVAAKAVLEYVISGWTGKVRKVVF